MMARLFALAKVVVANSGHTRDKLEEGVAFTVAALAGVGRQRLPSQVQQSRREQFHFSMDRVGVVRLGDDQTLDAVTPAKCGEGAHFLVHPPRFCGIRRTDDDQAGRFVQRFTDGIGEAGRCGQLFAILEDRRQALLQWTPGTLASDEGFGNPIPLERTMKPFCPSPVVVIVTDERRVPHLVPRAFVAQIMLAAVAAGALA